MSLNIPSTTEQDELGGVRLLSFDGGDLRTVSQLITLDEFMRRVEDERNSITRILPCDYFHMIGGVGASGIIVILLTVLRMGIEETINEFIKIWNLVFADPSLDRSARSTKLELVIKELLSRRDVDQSRRIVDESQLEHGCKAFVCAIPEINLGICEKFRTYKSRETSLNPTIVEAIRATCAVPSIFLPVSIDSIGCQVSYISGTYYFNNPSAETIKEACQYFGRDRRVACILSLGCGQRAFIRLSQTNETAVMSVVNDYACDCERVDRDLGWRLGELNVYYRLSVNRILESGDNYGSDPIGEITCCTKSYLEYHETTAKITKCVRASQDIGGVTLRDISGLNEPRSTSIHGLPPLSEFFVERPTLIKTMAQRLFQHGSSTQRRMVLSGLGGIGKTQIIISFLLRYLARFRHILFIDGSSEQSIENGLIAKIRSLGATFSRSSASEALEVLSNPDYEISRDWAIIYDNVDNPDINIGRYFPNCPFGTIVVTTRNPNIGNLAPKGHIRLDIMSEEEATQVLLRLAIDPSREPSDAEKNEARKIAKELGYLPVALAQAGYFIKVHNCMHDYRQRLRTRRPDILRRPAKHQLDAHEGLYAVLDITWPQLTRGAQSFMSILGFVNYTGFPIVLLYRAAAGGFSFESFQLLDRPSLFQQVIQLLCDTFRSKEWNEQDIDDLVAELEQYSLLTRIVTFKVTLIRLHPLVHTWAQDRLSEMDQAMYLAAAVRLLACGTGVDDEDIYEFVYPHVSVISNLLETLHVNDRAGFARILAHQGDRGTAIKLWEGIQSTLRPVYEQDDLRFGETDLQLARLYRRSGYLKDARALEDEVVRIRIRALGTENPRTLQAIVQQAGGLAYTSPKDATKHLNSALDVLGKQHHDHWGTVLEAKETLAFCCEAESIGIYTEILQTRMERNGPEHPATLKAMENLAKRYRKARIFGSQNKVANCASATDIWISLVSTRTSRRGREHPDTLDAMEHLAGSYALQNMYDKSIERWKEVTRLRKEIQGANHESTLRAMEGLARTYKKAGKYTEAAVQWKEVVRLTGQGDVPSQVKTLHTVREIADMFKQAGNCIEVAAQWKEIVHLIRQIHGPSHKKTLEAMASQVDAFEKAKKSAMTGEQWVMIVRLMGETFGPSDHHTRDAMYSLAKIYERNQRYTEAEVQWREIMRMTEEAYGPRHEHTLRVMGRPAKFYERIQWYTKAEMQWKEIIRMAKEAYGPGHASTWLAVEGLVSFYEERQQYTEAEAQWEEIIRMAKEANAPSYSDSRRAIASLARFYERRQRYDEAKVQWEEIIGMAEKAYGPSHGHTLQAMGDLASFYQERQQYTEAVVKWKEVMHLVTQGDGPIRGVTLDAMKSLTILYALTGRYTEAESQWKELFRNEETFHWHDSDWTFVGRLAEVYMSRGRYENAEAVLIDAKKYVVKDSDVKRVDLLLELLKFQLAKLGKVQGTSGDREASPEVAV